MISSIIIPTAGRPVAIMAAIQSLLRILPNRLDTEIIVVDNNTSQEMSDNLNAYCATLAHSLRYVREPSPGLSAARHRGAAEARGELLTFLDDDVEVTDTWLPAIQNAFSNSDVAVVGGPSIPKFTCSVPSWFWDFIQPTLYGGWMCGWLSLLDIGKDVENIDPNFIWGLNFSIRKRVLEECGGFHPDLVPKEYQRWQGDGETGLTMKIKAAGYRADYIHAAFVQHLCGPDRLNIEYFKKRAYYQGVCDSFTKIRKEHEPVLISSTQVRTSLFKKVHHATGKILRTVKGQTASESPWEVESGPIKALTRQAYKDGWLFHQNEVAADPELLSWVKRCDYYGADIRRCKNWA